MGKDSKPRGKEKLKTKIKIKFRDSVFFFLILFLTHPLPLDFCALPFALPLYYHIPAKQKGGECSPPALYG